MIGRILIVDDEDSIRFTFKDFLEDEGFTVATAADYAAAMECIAAGEFDLAYVDIILEGKSGIELLRSIREKSPATQVIIITGAPTIDSAAEAVRYGALDYIVKPVRHDTLLRTAAMGFRHKKLLDDKERYRHNLEAIFRSVEDGIVTVDRNMNIVEVNDAAERICGLSREKSVGALITAHFLGCNGKCVEVLRQTIETNHPMEVRHIECQPENRDLQVVSVRAAPLLKRAGFYEGAVMLIRDNTRLVQLERTLDERRQYAHIVGRSQAIRKVLSLIRSLADVPTSVLLTGESGTGKELVAEALHFTGGRQDQPLVKVNCSALSEGLLESELFGHVKGAFTGAVRDKVGRFQRADGGTIFLDEIGDITPAMQLRFLRVLEKMEFEPVGDSTPIRVDVRVVAATNQDLRRKVAEGRFREDLYYRLKVVEIALPPLRERLEDLPLLVDHMIKKFNRKFGKQIEAVSANVMEMFRRHRWPGNVRELENALEHAFVVCRHSTITGKELPAEFHAETRTTSASGGSDEAAIIRQALEHARYNKTEAARLLGISRRTLYRRLRRLGIQP